ncbi:hypothetical protein L596_018581 [Steinernema carpocapsae]|uniref:Uncharacterized protein n=1 Tax=Steinernema carpocapsae TaxID=34508 RepID=A0A4U5N645_STECR|nr:hypothetical protein L596_018581 [Steinernema carpocapsae]
MQKTIMSAVVRQQFVSLVSFVDVVAFGRSAPVRRRRVVPASAFQTKHNKITSNEENNSSQSRPTTSQKYLFLTLVRFGILNQATFVTLAEPFRPFNRTLALEGPPRFCNSQLPAGGGSGHHVTTAHFHRFPCFDF